MNDIPTGPARCRKKIRASAIEGGYCHGARDRAIRSFSMHRIEGWVHRVEGSLDRKNTSLGPGDGGMDLAGCPTSHPGWWNLYWILQHAHTHSLFSSRNVLYLLWIHTFLLVLVLAIAPGAPWSPSIGSHSLWPLLQLPAGYLCDNWGIEQTFGVYAISTFPSSIYFSMCGKKEPCSGRMNVCWLNG